MGKAILDLPEQHASVLSFLVAKVPPTQYLWALTGSAGLRLQGVDLSVNDLDLQTDPCETRYAQSTAAFATGKAGESP